ncbi:hypothetical protein MKW92_013466 [Papaver armeniacum]|nr:hypothetical protein MKW92_013466 [Papaver armeniacum]
MFNNQFDEFAAFSGDGFLPSQANQTTMNGVSPAKNRDSQGWLPLTVKQLSDFSISGVDVCNVRLVGMVFNKMESINEVTFMLDDKTSQVDCHRWVNDNIASKEMAEIKDGTFAEIQGTLKGFKGEKHLEAFSVRPVTDIDELAHLFRECMYVHCHNNKSQGQMSNSAQPQMTNAAITNGSVSYQTAPSNQICWQPTSVGINQKVLDFLSIPAQMKRENGVQLEELSCYLRVPLEKIMKAIRHLEQEGVVYSTIDKFHYKSVS